MKNPDDSFQSAMSISVSSNVSRSSTIESLIDSYPFSGQPSKEQVALPQSIQTSLTDSMDRGLWIQSGQSATRTSPASSNQQSLPTACHLLEQDAHPQSPQVPLTSQNNKGPRGQSGQSVSRADSKNTLDQEPQVNLPPVMTGPLPAPPTVPNPFLTIKLSTSRVGPHQASIVLASSKGGLIDPVAGHAARAQLDPSVTLSAIRVQECIRHLTQAQQHGLLARLWPPPQECLLQNIQAALA
jgi:hypothetical protein